MKKSVLFAAALFTVTAVSAQTGEITSAKGENWLSQDGDWGLTFDAQPLLNYAGNLFNNGTNNNTVALNGGSWATFTGLPANTVNGNSVVIGGKKLIDANTAYRGKLRIGFGSNKTTDLVLAAPPPNPQTVPPTTVEDVTKNGFMAIGLGAGLEKRVGSTRVVGVYGAELDIAIGSSKTTTDYGNAISNLNQVSRTTETKHASAFGVGLNAFAGVEWFPAPKVSIGGEYSWGLAMASRGTPEVTTESWDPTANNNAGAIVTTTTTGDSTTGNVDKTNSFSLDTGVSGASILVNFYFQ